MSAAHSGRLPASGFWAGKKVLLTGHTGFKGGWLTLWLQALGAEVWGLSLPPATTPSFCEAVHLPQLLGPRHLLGDMRELLTVQNALNVAKPDLVLHLAAQALVPMAYQQPHATMTSNVLATLHLLEALRQQARPAPLVVVTSDKVYQVPKGVPSPAFAEDAPLGGHDPYSASKAAAEIICAAYAASYGLPIVTARAGNVLGGGDWAPQRLVPDALRAAAAGQTLQLRQPLAVRPWQYVLDPLGGYLLLAEDLYGGKIPPATSCNFGPDPGQPITVAELLAQLAAALGTALPWQTAGGPKIVETDCLQLQNQRAKELLGWRPRYDLAATLAATASWYRAATNAPSMQVYSQQQIAEYARHDR